MASERLSKLQKYILTAAYTKTVLKKGLPIKIGFFERPAAPAAGYQIIDTSGDQHREQLFTDLYFSALYESDILLNFYGLQGSSETYGYKGGSNKEKTALHRSLKTLYQRGYINPYWQWSISAGEETGTFGFGGMAITTHELSHQSKAIVTLTPKGRDKAGELLKL